jgi:hypothetical protein
MLLSRQNHLLATLPAATYQKWEKHIALRELKKGHSLNFKRGSHEVYFPISCVVAIYSPSVLSRRLFMRFVGPSFAAGLVNMIAPDHAVFDGIVCGEGYAMTVPSEVVLRSIDTPSLSGEAQSTAMARTAKGGLAIAQCFGSHTVRQRLARLLLQAHDCFGLERPVTLTQQALGKMLMARRESAAEILAEWNRDGVVELKRGAIHIRSADTLKRTSCDCYSWIQESYLDELNLWKSIRWKAA